jgi:sterol desaturase/sphingolipid hydroxylase (fatty acid hydroxylase superfamily)
MAAGELHHAHHWLQCAMASYLSTLLFGVKRGQCPHVALQGAYMLLTVVALDYLHDAWFYWTHRLLHWKPLYRHVHHLHHRFAPRPT